MPQSSEIRSNIQLPKDSPEAMVVRNNDFQNLAEPIARSDEGTTPICDLFNEVLDPNSREAQLFDSLMSMLYGYSPLVQTTDGYQWGHPMDDFWSVYTFISDDAFEGYF